MCCICSETCLQAYVQHTCKQSLAASKLALHMRHTAPTGLAHKACSLNICLKPPFDLPCVCTLSGVSKTPASWQQGPFGAVIAEHLLQVMPVSAAHVSIVLSLHLLFAIGSPTGTAIFAFGPQEVCVIAAAVGTVACLACCLLLPRTRHFLTSRRPAAVSLKRTTLLGLVRSATWPWGCGQKCTLGPPLCPLVLVLFEVAVS